jgi:gamma-glutamyltranspeptidase / glutathione hydrolase
MRRRMPNISLATACALLAVLSGCARPTADDRQAARAIADGVPPAWPHEVAPDAAVARDGMVATDAPIATDVGVEVLRAGGNAIDAAIATAFALAVVYPEAGNIGGGGFLVVRTAGGDAAALDFREIAPAGATRDMYLDGGGNLTGRSVTGHLASGVPGAVMGLWEAHRRFGTVAWAELLAPAIRLAEQGFTVDADLAGSIIDERGRLEQFAGSRALYVPGGAPVAEGTTWRIPELAATLRRIAERGPDGFYRGETADLIVAEMQRGGGIITHDDLAGYRARWRDPVRFSYRGHEVISMPPPSSGGLTLALIARLLEPWDLHALGWQTPSTLHIVAEASRRAFAERNEFLADPDFVEIPTHRFLGDAHIDQLRRSISESRATPSAEVSPGAATGADGDHTTHFSVVDGRGNAVALTTTVNSLYGSAVVVTGAGFVLNNEMDDFAAQPGAPNQFGLVQGEANAIEPGKRMLSAMTPTIVVRDGEPIIVTGARGGPRIISAVFQVISNIIDHRMSVGAAVNVPRIHHQHLPDVLYFEANGLGAETVAALEALGHTVQARPSYIGNAPTILRRGEAWTGFADPRQGGRAAGY